MRRLLCGHPEPPTPDEIDTLLARISATGYASECVQLVEDWIEERYGVVGAFTANERATARHTVGVDVWSWHNGQERTMTFANEAEAAAAIATSMVAGLEQREREGWL